VREAVDGERLSHGLCLIAPGDYHLSIVQRPEGYVTRLTQTPPINFCRPAVDVLFRSAATAAGHGCLGVLLTGMGSDGALGLKAIREAGGTTIAEHEKTCVVYGMPRAAIQMGVVDQVVPLPLVAEAILESVAKKR
jgi:two-component system chemotaxis response regulator CheB